ncbi:MAG: BA14K family protein, partial [Pseudolabrys sp.]|nr:BA14K family protein [Pseudolabrys sp.]
IAGFSVLFGLDFVSAPMSPMPPSKYEIRAAVPPPPPAPAPVGAEAKPDTKPDAKPEATPQAKPEAKPAAAPKVAAPGAAAPAPAPLNAADQQPASIIAAEPGAAAATAAPKCNVEVCAGAYRSFTAADCTYQPSDGPRRLCTKGMPPPATPSAAASGAAVPEARAQACNVAACSQSYPRSFSAADCTFQPSEGPRRVCTK